MPSPNTQAEKRIAVAGYDVDQSRTLLLRLDKWSQRVGDQLNPILIKETRQALKSRQFAITFFSILAAAFAWTVVGSLSRMPQIYNTPSAPNLLIGYYALLAIPMLLVVPLAAYRSLEVEIDDGTLELLSISNLNPWQIVLGKLASSLLQIILYFIVLLPCMAYAYTLRGVDLTTIFLMITGLLSSGVLLTIVAIFLAPLTLSRGGRTLTLLLTVLSLIASVSIISIAMTSLIFDGNPLREGELFFIVTSCLVTGSSTGHLLLTATAARLTPESENRSTSLRHSVLALSSCLMFVTALAILTIDEGWIRTTILPLELTLNVIMISVWTLWTIVGSMLVAESPNLTPRMRRDLPGSMIGRSLTTWMTPGPITGLIFVSMNVLVLLIWFKYGLNWLAVRSLSVDEYTSVSKMLNSTYDLSSTFAAYLIVTLILVKWLFVLIRRKQNPRIEVGAAALIAITLLMALIPYAVGLYLNEFRPYRYTNWQLTNWVWTLYSIYDGNPPAATTLMIKSLAWIGVLATVILNPKVTRPRKTAVPQRVKQELSAASPAEGNTTTFPIDQP